MDYYHLLGVTREADSAEIKRAYRRLASQHHPDKGGDKVKFQEIQSAYDTLSDPQKRAMYDNPVRNPGGFQFDVNGAGFDFESIFDMFGARFNSGRAPQRQTVTRISLWIQLEDVAKGGKRPITLGTQHGTMTIEIEIPAGINDGDNVQYARLGPNSTDLVINYRIHPHPKWQRSGLNLTVDHSIDIFDLVTGGETTVADILGNQLTLQIPELTQPGSFLRLKGRGLPGRNTVPGDLLVRVQGRMPSYVDNKIIDAIKEFHKK
jgi:curved DNA-binding protein